MQQVSATLAGELDGVERDGFVLLDTHGGVVGSLHAGWRSGGGLDFSITVAGTEGTLVADGAGVRLSDRSGQARQLPLVDGGRTVQQAFVDAVASGRAVAPDGHDGRAAVAVVQAAYASAREGRTVQVG